LTKEYECEDEGRRRRNMKKKLGADGLP